MKYIGKDRSASYQFDKSAYREQGNVCESDQRYVGERAVKLVASLINSASTEDRTMSVVSVITDTLKNNNYTISRSEAYSIMMIRLKTVP